MTEDRNFRSGDDPFNELVVLAPHAHEPDVAISVLFHDANCAHVARLSRAEAIRLFLWLAHTLYDIKE